MTTIQQPQQQTLLEKEALTMVPVILGGPSPRRAGGRRWSRLRRPATPGAARDQRSR